MIKYLITITLVLFLNACSDRAYGEQDISKIPSAITTQKVTILSSTPSTNIAKSSYVNIEFSAFMDFETFNSGEITLIDKTDATQIEIEIDGIENHLYLRPLETLIEGREYLLSINSNATDIMGNSIDKGYEKSFICVEDFWEEVEVGETHSMALSKDGDIYIWGSNSYRELNIRDNNERSAPLAITHSNASKDFSAGSFTSAIINDLYELSTLGKYSLTKESDDNLTNVSVGNKHSAVIKSDGTLWSWGKNNNGQLGNAGIVERVELMQEDTNSTDWSTLSAGRDFTIALKNDGSMWGWGSNEFGQIGNAQYKERRVPVQEDTNATDWRSISAGGNHSSAIKVDGSLWSWGKNDDGVLGDGTYTSSRAQVQESSLSQWESVSSGFNHTLAIKNDGTLWAWGSNYYGQLGDGTVEDKNSPTLISQERWSSISGGKNFSIGVKEDGTMWSWGYNAQKQLGLGDDSEDKLTPTEVK